ncbi:MAG: TetR/AcrR family transcriptional regulator [Magnetococcales bacterium]|nr:TetR/AcrR family transcriptional regulator [Magnetococcales bacterium]
MGRTSDARERLIQSGMELIHAGGYTQAGVQEICDQAGVRKGSFYHFFPSKGDLALAVVERFQEQAREIFLDRALASDLPPGERILRFFTLAGEIQQGFKEADGWVKGCPFANLALEMSTRDQALRLLLEQVLQGVIQQLEGVAREAGQPPSAAQRTAEAIFSLFEGAILLAKTRNDPEVIRRMGAVAQTLIEMA